jgi:hypothetical protein
MGSGVGMARMLGTLTRLFIAVLSLSRKNQSPLLFCSFFLLFSFSVDGIFH